MATAEKIKSLIKSFGEEDESRFYATAMQIAASEAKKGHSSLALELKKLIEKAKLERSQNLTGKNKTISMSIPKRELKELIEILCPSITLKDMVLDTNVRTKLNTLLLEQKKWELLQKHDLRPKQKLLLTGLPGTGKTMTAQAIAGELNIPVYIIRLDGLMSKYMGESISKLRIIFDAMEDHRAVYLFDEFDSIGSQRNYSSEVGEMKRVLNSFLINIEKDNSNSIIIAATNIPKALDLALFRRFDSIINYPLPAKDEIINIIKMTLQGFSFSKRISYVKLAKIAIGLNYSEIVKACKETIKELILSERQDFKLNTEQLEYFLEERKKINEEYK
jgi:SpoVK/Ycf46/Vps4 family AAA+-type ATPase